jgi:hypothetical protein
VSSRPAGHRGERRPASAIEHRDGDAIAVPSAMNQAFKRIRRRLRISAAEIGMRDAYTVRVGAMRAQSGMPGREYRRRHAVAGTGFAPVSRTCAGMALRDDPAFTGISSG